MRFSDAQRGSPLNGQPEALSMPVEDEPLGGVLTSQGPMSTTLKSSTSQPLVWTSHSRHTGAR